ncbi:unnamed protein product [Spirodela intermedia]|uniref:Uncharacterized protein n=1 Tax=Spirodela intermedia TaxID=51605 RepID=A0A7I8LCH2_SPIIN|nr:unnamed protein product [Spirodela intermedia]
MGRQIVSGGCHLTEQKNGDFAVLRWLSPDGEELDGEVTTRLSMDRPLPDNDLAFTLSTYFAASVFLCTIFDNENDVSHPPFFIIMS